MQFYLANFWYGRSKCLEIFLFTGYFIELRTTCIRERGQIESMNLGDGQTEGQADGKISLWSIHSQLSLGNKFSEVEWVVLLFFLLKFFSSS